MHGKIKMNEEDKKYFRAIGSVIILNGLIQVADLLDEEEMAEVSVSFMDSLIDALEPQGLKAINDPLVSKPKRKYVRKAN